MASAGLLKRVWWLDSRTQEWRFYDPDPQLAPFNTLSAIDLSANPPGGASHQREQANGVPRPHHVYRLELRRYALADRHRWIDGWQGETGWQPVEIRM